MLILLATKFSVLSLQTLILLFVHFWEIYIKKLRSLWAEKTAHFTCDGELFRCHDDLLLTRSEQQFASIFTSHLQLLALSLHGLRSCGETHVQVPTHDTALEMKSQDLDAEILTCLYLFSFTALFNILWTPQRLNI